MLNLRQGVSVIVVKVYEFSVYADDQWCSLSYSYFAKIIVSYKIVCYIEVQ